MAAYCLTLLALPPASDLLTSSGWLYVARSAAHGAKHLALMFVVIYTIERLYGSRTSHYLSRNFLHDVFYWIYGRSDLFRIAIMAGLLQFLGARFAFLQVRALQSLPLAGRLGVSLVLADFLTYWIHRWQHSNRFLWAFHSMHHSQQRLSFATSMRTHPVDDVVLTTLAFVPLLIIGQPQPLRLPLYLAFEFMIALLHSEIPWRFGPFYRVFVSPTFHSIHHSDREEHHNRNFGRLLSIWDYCFGTAASDRSRPESYGVPDRPMPTIASQLLSPFRDAFDELAGRRQDARVQRQTAAR